MANTARDDRQRRAYLDGDNRLPSITSLKIGNIMLTERHRQHWGWDIAKRVGATRGTVSLIFQSFKRRGWVDCQVEQINNDSGKTPRVLYNLTSDGVVAIRDALIPFQHAPVST